VQEWIDELKHEWLHDVNVLREWVAEREKSSDARKK
jgi:two-component system, OmpR family, aerobic respiration control sensor histidine kinase ArcB